MLQRSTRAGFFVALAFLALVVPRAASADGPVDDAPGDGYRVVGLDGGVFAFGTAGFHGSTGALRLNQPIVGMAATPTGNGYWLVAADGGIFSFGDAAFHGSTGALRLNQPIVGMAATPTGNGYWLVALDGGIFAFGDAPFHGSVAGAAATRGIVVGIASTPTGRGYWLVNDEGAVSAFGDAPALGSLAAGTHAPVIGIASTPTGNGYWLATLDGETIAFGDAPALGSLATGTLAASVVGIAGPGRGSSGFNLALYGARLGRNRDAGIWPGAHQVALTFDDGPNPVFTPQILDVLARERVPATFFMIGTQVARFPDVAARVVRSGFPVATHAWNHETLTAIPDVAANLQRTADVIAQRTGFAPKCFRPPGGATNGRVVAAARAVGQEQVMWNADTRDWTGRSVDEIVGATTSVADGRPLVVLMHDGGGDRSRTVAALGATIRVLRDRGYEFVQLCG
jgi:peptidoglycan/xylan/chitin deacetylase (PgdA/CDA1 family)